jgi:hypothetical protein
MSLVIPQGMSFFIGRKQYGEGDELPANAPESVKKRCADYVAKLAKKSEPVKTTPDNSGDKNQ